jgi:hypothetical protein
MKQTKLMLLGILLILFGIAMATSIAPAVYSAYGAYATGSSTVSNAPFQVQALRFFPGIEVFLIIIGVVVGLVGYFQKEK